MLANFQKFFDSERIKKVQNSYDISFFNKTKEVIIFLLPSANDADQSKFQDIYQLYEHTQQLCPKSAVLLCTRPGRKSYIAHKFLPDVQIWRFEQVVKHLSSQKVTLFVGDYFVSRLYKKMSKGEITCLKSLKNLQINVLIDNYDIFDESSYEKNLYNLTSHVVLLSRTSVSQFLANSYQLPVHYVPKYKTKSSTGKVKLSLKALFDKKYDFVPVSEEEMKKQILLTVNVISYNHAKWIRECLDSIINQKTIFGFIIRIFDDASTDGTQDICYEYKKKYPDIIELYLAEKNLGPHYNPLRSYQNIKTPYYLYIESDDYRINENGFQMQIEALEKHPNCSFCAAKTINYENREFVNAHPNLDRGLYSKEDILSAPSRYWHANLGTRIVRSKYIDINPSCEMAYLWDISQFYELLEKGDMYFVSQNYMVYRMTGVGTATLLNGSCKILHYMSERGKDYERFRSKYTLNLLHVIKVELDSSILKLQKNEISIKSKKEKHKFRKIEKIFKLLLPGFMNLFFEKIRDLSRKGKKGEKND